MRVRAMSTASGSATAPPESPVPAPRATNGTSARWSRRTISRTSAGVRRHDDHAGIRLAGRQAIHGVGRELGAPVPHPARADDAAERVDQVRRSWAGMTSGSAPPVPVGVGAPVDLQRLLHRAVSRGSSSSSASTRRAVERSASSRCLTAEVDVDTGGDVEREARAASSGRSGSCGTASLSSRRPGRRSG